MTAGSVTQSSSVAAVAVAVAGTRARPGRLVAVGCGNAGGAAAPVALDADAAGHALGSLPVVTASPARLVDALERAGFEPPRTVWDVVELAVLIAPECPTDSLQSVAAFFGLPDDCPPGSLAPEAEAQLVAALFAALVAQLETVDLGTLGQVVRLGGGPLAWPLRSLFVDVEARRTRAVLEGGEPPTSATAWLASSPPPRRRRQASSPADQRPIDVANVAARLAPEGSVARALPGYEPRDEQLRMASAVADALNNGDRLLVEAGTGTGKTLAYLLPAVLAAVQNEWRVVVSTATTTLQDQLFAKDLPVLRASLGEGVPVRVCVLKGRSNYLCLRRWQGLLQAADLEPADRSLLIKTLFWVPRTRTGDRAELRLSAAEEAAWLRLCAVTEACTPARCAYHRLGICFIARARRTAEESHVVIVNHALLLSDAASRSRVLPDYDVLVIDEAHHLEAEATDQLGWRVGERELTTRLELLWGLASGARGAVGFLPEAVATLRAAPDGTRLVAEVADLVEAGERAIREAGQLVRSVFDCATDLLADAPVANASDDGASARVTAAVRAGRRWQELEGFWQDAVACILQVEQLAAELQSRLDGLPTARDDVRDLASELGSQLDYWRDARQRLNRAIHTPDAGTIYWLSGQRSRSVWLNAAPLDVADLLRDRLFDAAHAVVLVSATLAVGGSFAYVKRRLGLDEAVTVALGSPFDFRRAALLYVPNDLPDPTQSGYQASLEATLADVIVGANGRTLVLFTSRAQLRASYAALRRPLSAQGITVLGQGVDGASRTRLLEMFRRGGRVALFGTSSFWEGVDVVGEALSCVVVARLPFAVPTDPIYAARAEQFDDPFGQYAVPQAVLRLKQGFGRLIRSRTDRGAVVVLDRRLVTRGYGSVFVNSLPRCSVKQGPASRAGRVVAEWLAPSVQPPLLAVGG